MLEIIELSESMHLRYSQRIFIAFILFVVVILYITFGNQRCECDVRDVIKVKQQIAQELLEVHHDMLTSFNQKRHLPLQSLMSMEQIIHRLDVAASVSQPYALQQVPSAEVCPEEYKGNSLGYPFFHLGWGVANCSFAKPINTLLTVLINMEEYSDLDYHHVFNVFKGIKETHPSLETIVGVHSRAKHFITKAQKYLNVKMLQTTASQVGKVWNMLLGKVTTPYVLVARQVLHFNWMAKLHRQIRLLSQLPDVGVVGGSFRNLTGHWRPGCYHAEMRNYVLKYQDGYYHSRNSCMFCDHLRGPFVARNTLMKGLKFDESLPTHVVFEDFFLRLKEKGKIAMACPDSMYFMHDNAYEEQLASKQLWASFAKKWQLNRILLPGIATHSFSCADIGFTCKQKVTNSFLLPVCCLEILTKALHFVHNFSKKYNLLYELDSGSVLGGVKFNSFLPWDIDIDLSVFAENMTIFSKPEIVKLFLKNGYKIRDYKPPENDGKGFNGGFTKIDILSGDFYLELWGARELSNSALNFLPAELQKPPFYTKTHIRGAWINTVYNPAMYARSRYGKEILKHSQSWRQTGLKNSWEMYKSGTFTSCEKPRHHSCLDSFPGDGNLPVFVS